MIPIKIMMTKSTSRITGTLRMDTSVTPVLKLADLVKLQYTAHLEQLGEKQHKSPNSPKLKDCIPDLSAHKEDCDVLLAQLCIKACDTDYDDEAICLTRAAKIVRRDMLKLQSIFTGTFDKEISVPLTLRISVHSLSIKSQKADSFSQVTLSVAQLLPVQQFCSTKA